MAQSPPRHLQAVPDLPPDVPVVEDDQGNVRALVEKWTPDMMVQLTKDSIESQRMMMEFMKDIGPALTRSQDRADKAEAEVQRLTELVTEGGELAWNGTRYHFQGYSMGAYPETWWGRYKAWWHDRPWEAFIVHAGLAGAAWLVAKWWGERSYATAFADATRDVASRQYDQLRWENELQLTEARMKEYTDATRMPQVIQHQHKTVEKIVNPVIRTEFVREFAKPGARGPRGLNGRNGKDGKDGKDYPRHLAKRDMVDWFRSKEGRAWATACMPRVAVPVAEMSVDQFRAIANGKVH